MPQQDESTPLHELGLGFAGLIMATVVGSFLVYHLYLISYVTILLCVTTVDQLCS